MNVCKPGVFEKYLPKSDYSVRNTDQKVENKDQNVGSKVCMIRKNQFDSNGDAPKYNENGHKDYYDSDLFSVKLRPKTDSTVKIWT